VLRARFAATAVAAAFLGLPAIVPATASAATTASVVVPRVAFRDLGETSPATPISLAVTLAYHHPEQLEELVDLQSDPASPYFRHWLTSEQFAAAFAPSPAEYLRVAQTLSRAGFRVTKTFSNRTVIDVRGPAAAAERLFTTQIHRVYQPGYGLRYANVRPAVVPVGLQGLIFSVDGLNNLAIVHTDYQRVTTRFAARRAGSAPYVGPVGTITGTNGYGPLVFAQSYDYPTRHATGADPYNGTGRSAGIVIDADFLNSDIASFLKYFGIKRTAKTIRVPVDGGTLSDPGLQSDSVEATLDVSTIAANAPGATLYVYQTPPFAWGVQVVTDAYNQVVSDNKVDVLNSSFGLCENAVPTVTAAIDHLATQAAALGMTFHASTGDQGSSCVGEEEGVNIPASSPHVVAVGGTSLVVDPKNRYSYVSETGWGETTASGAVEGSGGGVSTVFPLPVWQKGVKNVQSSGRNLPDVSLDADPNTGTAFYFAGSWNNPWNPLGGTSLASPLFGAALAEIDEIVGGRTGLAGQRLFKLWERTGYTFKKTVYFNDITKGTNGAYSALPGYDNVTGIGSIDVWNIAQALKK
jgi:subtilase family serine protease